MLAAMLVVLSSHAQSLSDLADAQRVKQRAEIAKIRKEAAAAEAAEAPPVLKPISASPATSAAEMRAAVERANEAARPKIVLHALYARDNAWVAEVAEGQRLGLALVGMQFHGHRVAAVERRGLVLTRPCTAKDVREKRPCGTRVLTVGEAI
ncbi:hypothetical protein [Variovorax sp. KK3]|uniref:hypothetical protein n=2 Tax=Variovorax sp. KK3 TaxID=1855728 RepID=UPI00097C89CF